MAQRWDAQTYFSAETQKKLSGVSATARFVSLAALGTVGTVPSLGVAALTGVLGFGELPRTRRDKIELVSGYALCLAAAVVLPVPLTVGGALAAVVHFLGNERRIWRRLNLRQKEVVEEPPELNDLRKNLLHGAFLDDDDDDKPQQHHETTVSIPPKEEATSEIDQRWRASTAPPPAAPMITLPNVKTKSLTPEIIPVPPPKDDETGPLTPEFVPPPPPPKHDVPQSLIPEIAAPKEEEPEPVPEPPIPEPVPKPKVPLTMRQIADAGRVAWSGSPFARPDEARREATIEVIKKRADIKVDEEVAAVTTTATVDHDWAHQQSPNTTTTESNGLLSSLFATRTEAPTYDWKEVATSNPGDWVGKWRLQVDDETDPSAGSELIIEPNGVAKTSSSLASDASWRKVKGDIEIDMTIPRYTDWGTLGGYRDAKVMATVMQTQASVNGKVTRVGNESMTMKGILLQPFFDATVKSDISFDKVLSTATPTEAAATTTSVLNATTTTTTVS